MRNYLTPINFDRVPDVSKHAWSPFLVLHHVVVVFRFCLSPLVYTSQAGSVARYSGGVLCSSTYDANRAKTTNISQYSQNFTAEMLQVINKHFFGFSNSFGEQKIASMSFFSSSIFSAMQYRCNTHFPTCRSNVIHPHCDCDGYRP